MLVGVRENPFPTLKLGTQNTKKIRLLLIYLGFVDLTIKIVCIIIEQIFLFKKDTHQMKVNETNKHNYVSSY